MASGPRVKDIIFLSPNFIFKLQLFLLPKGLL